MVKNRVKTGVLLMVVMFVGLSVSIASAAEGTMSKMEARKQGIYNDLGLSPEQRKLLEDNKNKHREQTKVLSEQLRQKRESLRQELEKSELNMQTIQQTNNELKQLQAQMLDSRLERIIEVRKILTPEQFKKFADKTNEHKGRFLLK